MFSEWRSCSTTLCTIFHSSLCAVDYYGFSSQETEIPPTIQLVQPFLKLEQIHTFAFSYNNATLTANDVHAMATSWPNIQELRLRVDIVPDAAETYSVLQPLILFAHHCPLLQDLDVRIIDLQLPDLSDWPIIYAMVSNGYGWKLQMCTIRFT
jgi:hypothetical protein